MTATRYKIIAIQAEGADSPGYVIKDTITRKRVGSWFETRLEVLAELGILVTLPDIQPYTKDAVAKQNLR